MIQSFPLPSLRKHCFAAVSLLATTSLASAAVFTGWTEDYTGNEEGTLLLWKFDEGAERLDSSGHGWNISTNTNFTKGTFGTPGKFGKSYYADVAAGNTVMAQSIVSGVVDVFNGSAMSVEMWFAPSEETLTTGYLFDKQYSSKDGLQLQLVSDGSLKLTIGNGIETKTITSETQDWTRNEWQHVAVTYANVDDVGTAKIFLNGNLVASQAFDGFGDLTAGTRRWNIANRSGSTYFPLNGYYDNFRISNVAYEYNAIPEASTVGLLLGATPFVVWGIRRMRASK